MLEISAFLPHIFPIIVFIFSMIFMIVIVYILFKSLSKINVSGLLLDEYGNISPSKFWSNIAHAASTLAFLAANVSGHLQGTSLEIIWLIYLGVVGGSTILTQWIGAKYNRAEPEKGPDRYGYGNGGYGRDRYPRRDNYSMKTEPVSPQDELAESPSARPVNPDEE